ncbi:MAG: phytanoyl-CoA dioxygenase family protein [Saprospiraceae bacterium]|nr:phytanoyl-CoA dioxygenase family protein [Saprospiraceae bacterium]
MKKLDNTSAIVPYSGITLENIEFYKKNGFLIAEDLFSSDQIDDIKIETLNIFKGGRGLIEGLQKASEQDNEIDILRKYLCIHFPHKLSPVIYKYMSHNRMVNILKEIISPNVKSMQSMLFVKAPGKPGQSWHQDEYYIPTRDCSLTGAWIAIDDADIENGCIWVIPQTHNPAKIYSRKLYDGKEYGEHDIIDPTLFDHSKAIPVEVKSGAVVFFNGYLLHSSGRNHSKDRFRRALVYHYMSAESYLPWDQDGRLPLTNDMRDIVMVAGTDPYEHKGIEDLNKAYLRPDLQRIIKE